MRPFSRPVVFLIAVAVIVSVPGQSAHAEIPQVISYQGRVTDTGGTPVADGTYSMRFRIYNHATSGYAVWDSGTQSVTVTNGIFDVLLGESPQPSITQSFDIDYWLLVTIEGVNQYPRQRLASVGYAYMASGLVPSTIVTGSSTGSIFTATNTYPTSGYGIYGKTTSTQGGAGVYGIATGTVGGTYGVYGITESTEECAAIYGYASGFTGYITYGVHGRSISTSGAGVRGWNSCTSGITHGVRGKSNSTAGNGVSGVASATSGTTYGVHGTSESSNGTGVYGWASNTAGFTSGGIFVSSSLNGTGVQGEGDYRGGRFRDTDSDAYLYAGYDTYKTYGTGTNAFVQNHPRDKNRVIVYAAPEGDEVATYTRGSARLTDGEAHVELGETFKWVTNPDIGLTAHLTARGKGSVLFVESLTTEQMVVRSVEGFADDGAFDYIVYGIRIGFEEISIVQTKQEESYIPSMAGHRKMYETYPDLRQYNSLERFKRMRTAMGIIEPLDLSASSMLHDSIEEYNRSTHGSGDIDPQASARKEDESRFLEYERRLDEEALKSESISADDMLKESK